MLLPAESFAISTCKKIYNVIHYNHQRLEFVSPVALDKLLRKRHGTLETSRNRKLTGTWKSKFFFKGTFSSLPNGSSMPASMSSSMSGWREVTDSFTGLVLSPAGPSPITLAGIALAARLRSAHVRWMIRGASARVKFTLLHQQYKCDLIPSWETV